jgi:hypothetical protein
MSLDRAKLHHVHDLASGAFIAQCPACAEVGGDSLGQHLKVDAAGRFCCVVNSGKDGEAHRKRIFALAGEPFKPTEWLPRPKTVIKRPAVSIKAILKGPDCPF